MLALITLKFSAIWVIIFYLIMYFNIFIITFCFLFTIRYSSMAFSFLNLKSSHFLIFLLISIFCLDSTFAFRSSTSSSFEIFYFNFDRKLILFTSLSRLTTRMFCSILSICSSPLGSFALNSFGISFSLKPNSFLVL